MNKILAENTSIAAAQLFRQPVTVTAPETWVKYLHDRGVSDSVIARFGITGDSHGLHYGPQGRRRKALSPDAQKKYHWQPNKPDGALYYFDGGTLLAASIESGGNLWLTTEADLWIMHSAGIENSFALFSEASIPPDIGQWLNGLGIRRVWYAPDLDSTGELAARQLHKALSRTAIRLVLKQLPDRLGDGGDIGRYWLSQGKPDGFENDLKALPDYVLPEKPVIDRHNGEWATTRDATGQHRLEQLPESGGVSPDLATAIASGLGVVGYKPGGWSKAVCCPFHDDHTPSANWHATKHILRCFTCGETWLALDVAAAVGVDVSQYRVEAHSAVLSGLHSITRSQLCRAKLTSLARFLDCLYIVAGLQPGDTFTAKTAISALAGYIGKTAVYDLLKKHGGTTLRVGADAPMISPNEITIPEKPMLLFSSILTLEYPELINDKAKKPTRVFTVPAPLEVATAAGVKTDLAGVYVQPLPQDALRSNKAYRVAMLAQLIEAKPGQYSRAYLGSVVGVHGASTVAYDKVGEWVVTPQKSTRTFTPDMIGELPTRDEYAGHCRAYNEARRHGKKPPTLSDTIIRRVRGSWLENGLLDATGSPLRYAPINHSTERGRYAQNALRDAIGPVTLCTQECNHYRAKDRADRILYEPISPRLLHGRE